MKNLQEKLKNIFTEKEDEPQYDPQMFGAMVVGVIFTAGLLFWILWTALVYQGGIFGKISVLWLVLSGQKKWSELVPAGLPVSVSVFSGWLANLVATIVIFAIVAFLYYFYQKRFSARDKNELQ